jgi:hypothetical protein
MLSRCDRLDDQAKSLMGMSGVSVYERRTGYTEVEHSYEIVWGGRKRWSVPAPWDENKWVLREVGMSLRSDLYNQEQFEKSIRATEKLEEDDAKEQQLMADDISKQTYRTAVENPIYFYNK